MVAFFKEMGGWDLLAFGGVALLVIRGFVHGCSGEVGRLAGVVTAAAVGFFGFNSIARLVLSVKLFDANPYAGRLIVFILMMVVCIALWQGISHLLSEGLRLVLPQPFDAILGGVIGGIKAFVIIAALCTLGLLNPREEARTELQEKSVTVQKLAPFLKRVTSPER